MGRETAQNVAEDERTGLGSVSRKAAQIETLSPDTALPQSGQIVGGKYRIAERLGRGAMGAVFRATHVVSQKQVAIKWMLRSTADESAHRRFLREALAAGRINHPNVVDVYDVGEEGACAYLVMELLHGEALKARLERGPLQLADAIAVLLPALRGVSAAHRAGVVHRDLKPDNIFLCTAADGAPREAKVLDFGIASVLDGDHSDPTLTKDGAVLGTPVYMSPEQLQNARDVDVRADVYAFGVILYEALTGQRPFSADSYPGLVLAIVHQEPLAPSRLRADLPSELEHVVLRALAKNRDERYPDMDQLIAALSPFARVPAYVEPVSHARTALTVTEAATSNDTPPVRAVAPSAPVPSRPEPSLRMWLGALLVALGCAAVASTIWLASPSAEQPTAAAPTPVVTQQYMTEDPQPYLPQLEHAHAANTNVSAVPRSCEEAKLAGRSADTLLKIDPDGPGPVRAFEVFCAGMGAGGSGPAREYLPLVHGAARAEASRNVTRFVYGEGSCACPDLVSHFTRVRVEPRTLTIDPTDVTFASYDRPLTCEIQHASQCGESAKLIWGGAGSCRAAGDTSGSASIDLRGTPFALSPRVRFVPAGFGAAGRATISGDRKTATLVGGGHCGSLVAEQGGIALVADR